MTVARLDFGPNQEGSNEELSGASPLAVNVMVDGRGTVRRRPGIATWADAGTPVYAGDDIVAIAESGSTLYFAAERATAQRYLGSLSGGVQTALTTSDAGTLHGTARPWAAVTSDRVVFAGGAELCQYRFAATVSEQVYADPLSSGATYYPPDCSTVDAFASRLFVNDETSTATQDWLRPSGLGQTGYQDYDPLDYVAADAKPDAVQAIANNANELYVWGKQTLQIFVKDALAIVAPARTYSLGISAPHSLVRTPDSFVWLDQRRRIVRTNGREVVEISQAISSQLGDMATVADCWGGYLPSALGDLCFWVFPSDGRTFVYQVGGGWAQWHSGASSLGLWLPTSTLYWEDQGVQVVGLGTGGFAKLDDDTYTDLGAGFKVLVRTGFVSRDTSAYKRCNELRLRLRRLSGAAGGVVRVSWRDDLGAFGRPYEVDISGSGEYEPVVRLSGLGTYRQRQWQIDLSDTVGLSLSDAEEDFTVT